MDGTSTERIVVSIAAVNGSAVRIGVALALLAGFAAFLLLGNRPSPERFASVNGLTLDEQSRAEVACALRRTYRGRIFGGAASLLVTVCIALAEGSGVTFARGLVAVLAGTLVGITLAQFTRLPDPGALRVASIEARDADDYRPRHGKVTISVALVVLALVSAISLADHSKPAQVAVITIATLGLAATAGATMWLQRRIVERAQDAHDEARARVDVALRASAVRALHHAAVGILLCGIAFVGVGAGEPARIVVHSEPSTVTGHGVPVLELPGDSREITFSNDDVSSRIEWTDASGHHHAREFTNSPTDHHLLTTERQHDVPSALIAIAVVLGFLAGLGALLEWRAAARAWRRPGPRRPPSPLVPAIAPVGSRP